MVTRARRHLISVDDVSDDDLRWLVQRACEYSTTDGSSRQAPLAGTTTGIYFKKTSTRTRTAFSVGALRLGGQIIAYGPNDLQLNTGESIDDTGQVLASMLDGFVARTAGAPDELRAVAQQNRMAVVNAMTEDEHPTQAITDLSAMTAHFGRVEGLRVLYLGEGNNTASALALALARFPGAELHLRTPPGYGVLESKMKAATRAAEAHEALVEERHDLDDLPAEVDIVYTTRWQTTGTDKPDPNWREVFEPFRVTEALCDRFPGSVFMHDLPAHRGEEVEAAVLDGPRSIAFGQAAHKLYGAMSVLEWCMGGLGHPSASREHA